MQMSLACIHKYMYLLFFYYNYKAFSKIVLGTGSN